MEKLRVQILTGYVPKCGTTANVAKYLWELVLDGVN